MERFFCTICRKIKRVHSLPHVINADALLPKDRVGHCAYHMSGLSRAVVNNRRSVIPKPTHTKRASAPAPVEKKPTKKNSRARA